ncbi:hypothetical protein QQF64_011851 [Cirrhinus molitorella]|uniref:Uncharacterized protein n=1 Tax=Cirrhinus molitorella TaxID=172907 RepID=A0ABR3LW46_9TELE
MNAIKEIPPHGSHSHSANESLLLRLQLCHPLTTSKVEVKWIIESSDPPPIAEHTTSSGEKADPPVPHTHTQLSLRYWKGTESSHLHLAERTIMMNVIWTWVFVYIEQGGGKDAFR